MVQAKAALAKGATQIDRLWRRWRGPVGEHMPFAQGALAVAFAAVALVAVSAAAAPAGPTARLREEIRQDPALGRSALDGNGLNEMRASLSPGVRLALARLEQGARVRDVDATPGWAVIDLHTLPDLGFGQLTGEDARLVSGLIADAPAQAARPFRLPSLETATGRRALRCLTEAVYYETGRDDDEAQAAVAQVVLNRVRHPAYPSSVCGVVYQGAMRTTGCQFSFTCDGSLTRGLMPEAWRRAEATARRALTGHVVAEVGSSTNYHADYVLPYWARTVVRIAQVGPHIFYRWTGPLGLPSALTQRYSGDETNISQAVLASWDNRTQGVDAAMSLGDANAAPSETRLALNALKSVGLVAKVDDGRVRAFLNPVRRKATPEEVKAINDRLSEYEKGKAGSAPEAAAPVEGGAAGA